MVVEQHSISTQIVHFKSEFLESSVLRQIGFEKDRKGFYGIFHQLRSCLFLCQATLKKTVEAATTDVKSQMFWLPLIPDQTFYVQSSRPKIS